MCSVMPFYENHSHSSISAPILLSIYLLILICLFVDTKKYLVLYSSNGDGGFFLADETFIFSLSIAWAFWYWSCIILIKNNKALLVWKIFLKITKNEKSNVFIQLEIARMSVSITCVFGRGSEAGRRMVKRFIVKEKKSQVCLRIGV